MPTIQRGSEARHRQNGRAGASRTAVVTGAARGIGAGIAKRMATDGFAVAVVDSHEGNCWRIADEIRAVGGRALAVEIDVSDDASVANGIARIAAELGPPAVLVNSAGILQDSVLFAMSDFEIDEVLDLNLSGAIRMSSAVQAYMTTSAWGRIVNLSSTPAPSDPQGWNSRSTDAGLADFTAALAIELGDLGVTVNAITPGFIETELTELTTQWLGVPIEDFRNRAAWPTPAPRIGVPEDIAHAVSFFASEGAGFISGQTLRVSGATAV